MCSRRLPGIIVGVSMLWVGRLSADPIADLYDTGVGVNGAVLTDGTSPDPHYMLTQAADGSTTTTVKTSASGFPVGGFYWNGDSTTSAWIMPNLMYPGDGNYPIGDYDYQTTFTLPINASAVSISLNLAADDESPGILLNGVLVDIPPSTVGFSDAPVTFTSGDIVAGTNTLTFVTYNSGTPSTSGPTGLRVDDITGSYTAVDVPEPCTLGIFGFALLLFRRRRDQSRNTR